MNSELVPIFVCVVLPVSIVLIVYLTRMNSDNKRAQIIIKAIEANNDIDADKLAESLRKPQRSAKEILHSRLLCGCIFSFLGVAFEVSAWIDGLQEMLALCGGACLAVGLGFLVTCYVTRKDI